MWSVYAGRGFAYIIYIENVLCVASIPGIDIYVHMQQINYRNMFVGGCVDARIVCCSRICDWYGCG